MVIINPFINEDSTNINNKFVVEAIIDSIYRINNGMCFVIDEKNVQKVVDMFKKNKIAYNNFRGIYLYIYNSKTKKYFDSIVQFINLDKVRVVVSENIPVHIQGTEYGRSNRDLTIVFLGTLGLFPESQTADKNLIYYLKNIVQKQHPLRNVFIELVRDAKISPEIAYLLIVSTEGFIINNKVMDSNDALFGTFLNKLAKKYNIDNEKTVIQLFQNEVKKLLKSRSKDLLDFIDNRKNMYH